MPHLPGMQIEAKTVEEGSPGDPWCAGVALTDLGVGVDVDVGVGVVGVGIGVGRRPNRGERERRKGPLPS